MEKNLNLFANVTFDASNWKSNLNPSCLQQVNEKSKSLSKIQKKALMIIFNIILDFDKCKKRIISVHWI